MLANGASIDMLEQQNSFNNGLLHNARIYVLNKKVIPLSEAIF